MVPKKLIWPLIGVFYFVGALGLFSGFWINAGLGEALFTLVPSCGIPVFVLLFMASVRGV